MLSTTRKSLRGLIAGLVATAAMSAFMLALERAGPMRQQPPRLIVDRFVPQLPDTAANVVAVVSHGAYGAMAGGAFAALAADRSDAVRLGSLYGLALWAFGYEGWVPAVQVLPPAHRDRAGRVLTMIGAHVIYGTVLGRLLRRR